MSQPTIFAQIRKVDEEKRLVFGRAAEEAVDKADEIMDYMSSKPHFEKWSADCAADSGGKNLGNVRAMHGKVAAGALTAIEFDDGAKAIDVCAKIVDDAEWKKVLAGVYTGFSIGGSYVGEKTVEKMADGRQAKRYTAKPGELSLVDRPCMPGAKFFEVQKADGSLTKVDFVEVAADELEVNGTAEDLAIFAKTLNGEGMSIADLNKALPAFLADKKKKAEPDADDKGGKSDDDADDAAKAVAAGELEKVEAAASDAALTAVEKAFTDHKDVLAKIGARNSAADKARLGKIHDAVVELGHDCGAAKTAPAGDLTKVDDAAALAKIETDRAEAFEKVLGERLAPMQKLLDDATSKIAKLEAQPAAPKVRLRAVSKGEDMVDDPADLKKAAPVIDGEGKPNETAGLIKSLHAQGGVALHLPRNLRE